MSNLLKNQMPPQPAWPRLPIRDALTTDARKLAEGYNGESDALQKRFEAVQHAVTDFRERKNALRADPGADVSELADNAFSLNADLREVYLAILKHFKQWPEVAQELANAYETAATAADAELEQHVTDIEKVLDKNGLRINGGAKAVAAIEEGYREKRQIRDSLQRAVGDCRSKFGGAAQRRFVEAIRAQLVNDM